MQAWGPVQGITQTHMNRQGIAQTLILTGEMDGQMPGAL